MTPDHGEHAGIDQGISQAPFRYCAMPAAKPQTLAPNLAPNRTRAILMLANKWANGTRLQYYFFTEPQADGELVTLNDGSREWRTWVGSEPDRDIVRTAFSRWKALGIGIEFAETAKREEAEIRIGFMPGDGSWSYVGTDILGHGPKERTMNFGWSLLGHDGPDTALHEIGHSLGLPHEHQNPNAGIIWKEEAVYTALAGPPNNWTREETFYNIIRKIPPDAVQGSSWDPDSIMHYPFEAGLIMKPAQYAGGLRPTGGLSPRDITWVKTFYPQQDQNGFRKLNIAESQPLNVDAGGQADFLFEAPATRKYKVQTFGSCDTQIVIFEEVDGQWRYLSADDDSGEDRNALIDVRLRDGKRYAVRVRLKYDPGGAPPSVMLW